jgi:archaemetzincin
MHAVSFFLILGSFFFLSCTGSIETNNPPKKQSEIRAPSPGITITIQPFDDIPDSLLNYIQNELKKVYDHVEVKKSIPLPPSAFYSKRHRYRADSLINFLGTITPENHVTIGLTTKDISHTKGTIEDYGIMGLGFQPGPACVVSTFRLSKQNLSDQYFKLAIHELGHTQGLPHCPETTCYMRDAEGKNTTNEETGFCGKCKAVLVSRQWKF